MNKIRKVHIPVIIFFLLLISSCGGKSQKTENVNSLVEASMIEVSIEGMTCTGCEQKIQSGISGLEGIKSVKASHLQGKAIVEYFPDKVDTLKIKDAVKDAGYLVKKINSGL